MTLMMITITTNTTTIEGGSQTSTLIPCTWGPVNPEHSNPPFQESLCQEVLGLGVEGFMVEGLGLRLRLKGVLLIHIIGAAGSCLFGCRRGFGHVCDF